MAPGVVGSIPVSHPGPAGSRALGSAVRPFGRSPADSRSVAQLVEHRSPKPAVGGSIPSWPARQCFLTSRRAGPRPAVLERRGSRVRAPAFPAGDRRKQASPAQECGVVGNQMAVSSRGLGRGPLKAVTRVRIPLPLLSAPQSRPHRLSVRTRPFQGRETGSTPVGAMQDPTGGVAP